MDKSLLESLLKALEFSPNNVELRFQIVKIYLDNLNYEEAEKHLLIILDTSPTDSYKFHLALCYFKQSKLNLTDVILEELLESHPNHIDYLELQCKCYIEQNHIQDALSTYQNILEINPSFKNEDFENLFKLPTSGVDGGFIDEDAMSFLKKPDMNFTDVGGMDKVKEEIDLKIIKPLLHKDLYKAYGKKIGGGILLYGPPGCGKTHIARATAGEINANFINIGINDILDMWLGSSEKIFMKFFKQLENISHV